MEETSSSFAELVDLNFISNIDNIRKHVKLFRGACGSKYSVPLHYQCIQQVKLFRGACGSKYHFSQQYRHALLSSSFAELVDLNHVRAFASPDLVVKLFRGACGSKCQWGLDLLFPSGQALSRSLWI